MLRPYRLTVDVYERIVASGALGEGSEGFLWNGQLVEPIGDLSRGRPHAVAVNELVRLLADLVRARGYFVAQDQPIALSDNTASQPNLQCVRGAIRDYLHRTPTGQDCPLVVKIFDSRREDDWGEMLRGYAAADVPAFWVVTLSRRRIDVYTQPSGPARSPSYAQHESFGPDDLVPVVLDGRELGRITVRDVLP